MSADALDTSSKTEDEIISSVLSMNDEAMNALRVEEQKTSHNLLLKALNLARQGLADCKEEDTMKNWLHAYALTLSNFGCQLYRESFAKDARRVLEEAIKIEKHVYGKASCPTMLNLSSVLLSLEEPKEALEMAKQCTTLSQNGDPVLFITSLHNLAVILGQQAGEVERNAALPTMLRALRESETLLGADHPTTAMLREKCRVYTPTPLESNTQKAEEVGLAAKRPASAVPPPLLQVKEVTQHPEASKRTDTQHATPRTFFSQTTPSSSARGIESPTALRNQAVAALRTLDFGSVPPETHAAQHATYPSVIPIPVARLRSDISNSSVSVAKSSPHLSPPKRASTGGMAPPSLPLSSSSGVPTPMSMTSPMFSVPPALKPPTRHNSSADAIEKRGSESRPIFSAPHRPSLGSKRYSNPASPGKPPRRPQTTSRSVFKNSYKSRKGEQQEEAEEEAHRLHLQRMEERRKEEEWRQKELQRLNERSRRRAAVRIQSTWRSWWREVGQPRKAEKIQRELRRQELLRKTSAVPAIASVVLEEEPPVVKDAARACAEMWLEKTEIIRYLARRGIPHRNRSEALLQRKLRQLQAVWRGACVRERLPTFLATEEAAREANLASEERHYAAIVIQTNYRARLARLRYMAIENEKNAEPAKKIQQWWRSVSVQRKIDGVDWPTRAMKEERATVIQRAWRRYKMRVAISMYLLRLQMIQDEVRTMEPTKRTAPKAATQTTTTNLSSASRAGSKKEPTNETLLASQYSDTDSVLRMDRQHYTNIERRLPPLNDRAVSRKARPTPEEDIKHISLLASVNSQISNVASSTISGRMRELD
ncbi:Tetratricopeptide repeat/IQ calmodulin-binding motif containing protein, putative [Angomonas deanei]|uniref:Tetratricopeptide repeat/IQ calmodulin-binding motif containing protein, putative n=1 Tax=Angomonas deanei TaxID=59799 RepID=A0A7G2C5L4_9TRYP|nr:Tetratricopeptide repeat/IQ calmodulin-binding motif containing protein, putative [Angomonas deanei]